MNDWKAEAERTENARKNVRKHMSRRQREAVEEILNAASRILDDARDLMAPRIDDLSRLESAYWSVRNTLGPKGE